MATEKRMIDANKFKHKMKLEFLDRRNKFISMNDLFECIDDMPTVGAVEVVRCKDCKYCDPENHYCDHYTATILPLPRKLDGYCSYGERKDDD